ncbi:hypothetical protein [Mycobacteroides chelonae]|uniref:hypothetical protein n=1 Tax=Mycobacteroides chelonae TaxID=1774 RepID=UPI0018B098A0|nr:hypothetical protein [Mycobacteroides chelonae]MBF9325930.1 hypothetical protein [Mycobacteroides chelonae]MBF9420106.1 hypothetical protein [Mycobacteroides chelonae]
MPHTYTDVDGELRAASSIISRASDRIKSKSQYPREGLTEWQSAIHDRDELIDELTATVQVLLKMVRDLQDGVNKLNGVPGY